MPDEECNRDNRDGCARYHKGAIQCFKMVNPRSAIVNGFWSVIGVHRMFEEEYSIGDRGGWGGGGRGLLVSTGGNFSLTLDESLVNDRFPQHFGQVMSQLRHFNPSRKAVGALKIVSEIVVPKIFITRSYLQIISI